MLVPLLALALVGGFMPMSHWLLEVLWLAGVCIFFGWLALRVWRAGVFVGADGVEVRNVGRTNVVRWDDVDRFSTERIGRLNFVVVHRRSGGGIVLRAAGSYSRAKAKRWRDQLEAARRC
jgi:hypothetical protein